MFKMNLISDSLMTTAPYGVIRKSHISLYDSNRGTKLEVNELDVSIWLPALYPIISIRALLEI
jgi:hypothetical protein